MSQQATHLYEFGPFRIDTKNRLLFRDGQAIPLKPKVVETLLVLVENSGRVLEKDELIQILWPETFVEEANLTQNIYVLRKALSDGADSETYIETIPRRGYRFAGKVKRVVSDESVARMRTPGSRKWLWIGGFSVAVIAMASLYRFVLTRSNTPPANAGIKSLAVLPFKPLIAGAENDYISEGMADALITRLSNNQQITVKPTSSILRYVDARQDPLAAGHELGVDAVLDGKIQRAGNRVRVTVQLLRVADGSPVWADQYDEDFTNIFALQDSISTQAARSLTVQLSANGVAATRKRYTDNVAAYEAYLQGRYFWNKRNSASFRKAIEHFQQALEIDPNYALAHAGLADCYIRLNEYGGPMVQEAVPKARAAVTKALTIDDTLAEAHATLGFIKFRHDWDLAGADVEFKRSLQLDPNYSEAHQWYAFYLLAVGRQAEGDAEMKQAQGLDPLSVSFNSNLALYQFFRHQFDQSLQQCRKTLEMEPTFTLTRVTLGLNYENKGFIKEALAEFKKLQDVVPNDVGTTAALGHALAQDGQTKEGRRLLAELEERAKTSYVPPYSVAIIHAGLGEQSQALDWLERGFQDRSLRPVWLLFDPRLDQMRKEERFIRLVQRMGLPTR